VSRDAQDLVEAAHALSGLGLVTAYGHVSYRTGDGLLITPAADLAGVEAAGLVAIPGDATALPPGAPAESWLHLCLYRVRPDLHAIARAQPPAAFAAAATTRELRPYHGQASWLGRAVPVHDDARLLRTPELAEAAARCLTKGEALLLRGNGAVTAGASPGLAVARMWLLSVACQVWLSVGRYGYRRPLTDAEVASWRAVQPELLPRLWQHLRRTTAESQLAAGGTASRTHHPPGENSSVTNGGAMPEDELLYQLAAESIARDDPTGWFERLYVASTADASVVPWDRGAPNPRLVEWAEATHPTGQGRALVVGAGLGADAEYVAGLGYETTAFDVSETAVRIARDRNPGSPVRYVVADLLDPPGEWHEAFDLVVEIYTVQSMPESTHTRAAQRVAGLVAPGGRLLVVAMGRFAADTVDEGPPWPLTDAEIAAFATDGLAPVRIEDIRDPAARMGRRWRAEFRK
jgi:HCOMODA/2-hydroxy-3-carboxy-muconic semialdehyde decarboxylase